MKLLRYGGLYAVCLIVFLLMSAPLSVAVGLLGKAAPGLSFQRAEGRLWGGRLVAATLNGRPLGDVELSVRPLGFLTGALSVSWAVDGPSLAGDGVYVQRLGGAPVLKNAKLRADLRRLGAGRVADAQVQGMVDADVARASFGRKGCLSIEADIWTDALIQSTSAYGWKGAPLTGAAACDDGRLVLPLSTAEAERKGELIKVTAVVRPDLTYRLTGAVETEDPELRLVLPVLGFREEDGVYGLSQDGALNGARPVS
ncbi:MAG: type II secretion system protein N [Pseudomonadota bacterium]